MGQEQQRMSAPKPVQHYANQKAPGNLRVAYPNEHPPEANEPTGPPVPQHAPGGFYHPYGSAGKQPIDPAPKYAPAPDSPREASDSGSPPNYGSPAPVEEAPQHDFSASVFSSPSPSFPPPYATGDSKHSLHDTAALASGLRPNAKLSKDQAAGRDYVLLIDMSGSMNTEDCPNDNSRFKEAHEGVIAFADMMDRLDPDGIDVCVFNDEAKWFRGVHKDTVSNIFGTMSPRGGTILAPVLQEVLLAWLETRKRPITVVIITDGMPTDKKEVLETLVVASKRLEEVGGRDEDVGISFIQIGYDESATAFLKELDDDLQAKHGAPFDIVDTCPMVEVAKRGGIKQVLLNAVND